MDLWVVAAATGAGYIAKYWQNLSREGEGSSESYPVDNAHGQFESPNLLQQMRDQTCPLRRLAQNQLDRDVSLGRADVSDGRFSEVNKLVGDSVSRVASTSGSQDDGPAAVSRYEDHNVLSLTSWPLGSCGRENFQEFGDGSKEKKEFYDNSYDFIPDLTNGDTGSFNRVARSRPLRGRRPHWCSVKPLNSSESSLTAQLYRKQAATEEYVYSSLPSPSTLTVRPLLVTDGSRVISKARSDFKGEMRFDSEENRTLLGVPQLPKRSVELPRKPKQNIRKGRSRRLSSSIGRISGKPSNSHGSHKGMLLFFLGITLGIISTVVANKREVDKLHELLKHSENLVKDLHEELEMKNLLTVKELSKEDYESLDTNKRSFLIGDPTAFSEHEVDEFKIYEVKEPDNKKAENFESMSKIEAELEAELERLELNMKASSLERMSDFLKLDPDFEADVVQGELGVNTVNGQPGDPSDSDHDASGSSTNHINTANYAVSPRELSLRLHEVIQSRLEARIIELEAALQDSRKSAHSMEPEHIISQRDLYREVESSSTQESPAFVDEGNDVDQPLVINLSGEALNAYNEAYEEISRTTKTDEDPPPETTYNGDYSGNEMRLFDKLMYLGQNGGDNGSNISHCESMEERQSRSLLHDRIRTLEEEQTSRSRGSNEVGENEDEDGDEMGELLIKQILEKNRQGSPVVLNVQQMLYSLDDDQ